LAKALGQELARNELGGAPEGFDVAAFGAPILRGIVVASAFLGLREIYRRLRGRQGIGLGDVKLAAVAGAWLDWMMIPIAIEIAALTALAAYAIGQFILRRPFSATARLPFGLFFGPAIWFGWVIQAWLLAV
jgi:leader peptidase (prepilin peptidase)/N-methyltransferase